MYRWRDLIVDQIVISFFFFFVIRFPLSERFCRLDLSNQLDAKHRRITRRGQELGTEVDGWISRGRHRARWEQEPEESQPPRQH